MRLKIKVTGPKRLDIKIPVKCPSCGRTLELKAQSTAAGSTLKCSCGSTIRIAGDDQRGMQRAMDDLVRSIHKLGK